MPPDFKRLVPPDQKAAEAQLVEAILAEHPRVFPGGSKAAAVQYTQGVVTSNLDRIVARAHEEFLVALANHLDWLRSRTPDTVWDRPDKDAA